MTTKRTRTLCAPFETLLRDEEQLRKPRTAMRWHLCSLAAMALATSTFVGTASAQTEQAYPNRPVRLILPYSTGGSSDVLARFIGPKLADGLGQQVVIENRPGAGGIIGVNAAAKSPPDGYALLMSSSAEAMLPSLYKVPPYNYIGDFTPISLLIDFPFLLVVHPSVPVTSVGELIALAKSKPKTINYASGGNGSSSHIVPELFASMAGVSLVHVPYKGTGPAVLGLVAGDAGLGVFAVASSGQQVKAGRLRALASTGLRRSPSFPDLPTVAEAGVPGFEASIWIGVLAPTGTPQAIVAKLQREFTRVLKLPEIQKQLAALDFTSVGSTPEEFAAVIKKDVAKWGKVVKDSGATAD